MSGEKRVKFGLKILEKINKGKMMDNENHDIEDAHGPIEEEFQEKMRALGIMLEEVFNEPGKKEIGFCLLVFKFGEPTDTSRMNYIGNSNREDMIKALEEFVGRAKRDAEKKTEIKRISHICQDGTVYLMARKDCEICSPKDDRRGPDNLIH